MAVHSFTLDIKTPTGAAWEGEVEAVTLPGVVGPFQVLYNHAPLLTELAVGVIKVIRPGGGDIYFAVSGGFVEVRSNEVIVLADTIEESSVIDAKRAENAVRRAEERLKLARSGEDPGVDVKRAEESLARARNRLRTLQQPV